MRLMGVMEERPPFVQFERRPIEKRGPPPEGAIFYEDVDFAVITPQGTKDMIEKRVDDWFAYLATMVGQNRYNPDWLKGFQGAYQQWKQGLEMPLNGSAIKNWPAVTPSEIKRLSTINIHTIEDLANMPEEGIAHIGPGGRSLRTRAQDWLTAQKDTAPLVVQLDSMRILCAQLETDNKRLQERIEALQSENRALATIQHQQAVTGGPSLEDRLAAAQAAQGADPGEEILRRL